MMFEFNFKERLDWILYTLKHKVAFLKVEKQLRGRNTFRGLLHDLDKVFLYMIPWINLEDAHKHHVKKSSHHLSADKPKTLENIEEAVIDWECAPLTKPDKPLNAYETLYKYYPEYIKDVLPVIQKWLPHQIIREEDKIKSISGTYRDVTERDFVKEIEDVHVSKG